MHVYLINTLKSLLAHHYQTQPAARATRCSMQHWSLAITQSHLLSTAATVDGRSRRHSEQSRADGLLSRHHTLRFESGLRGIQRDAALEELSHFHQCTWFTISFTSLNNFVRVKSVGQGAISPMVPFCLRSYFSRLFDLSFNNTKKLFFYWCCINPHVSFLLIFVSDLFCSVW